MRVLGKVEISNAIKLNELEMLMSNFGPPSPREHTQPTDPEEVERAGDLQQDEGQDPTDEQKMLKQIKRKKQISQLVDQEDGLQEEIASMIDAVTFEGLKKLMGEKVYKMLAKLKKNNKQVNESVINRDDLLEVLKAVNGKGLSEKSVALIQPLVQVNPNHGHIYQAKIVGFLLDEVNAKKEIAADATVQQT